LFLVIGASDGLIWRPVKKEQAPMTDNDARTLAALQTVGALARLTVPADALDAMARHERAIAAEQERRACA